jgi:hypothetical protein
MDAPSDGVPVRRTPMINRACHRYSRCIHSWTSYPQIG